jgi:hypothetical protein
MCLKTQSDCPQFFRVLVAYYFAKVAASMRATVNTIDRGSLPINIYAVNLAPSGTGKGLSTNIMEEQVLDGFRHKFMEETFPALASKNLVKLAHKRANKEEIEVELAQAKVEDEFALAGELAFSFDSATTAAVKQMRHKLLMANAGSVNMEIDEIGSNLLGNVDVLVAFLELYDVGKIKQKLTKNTKENLRGAEIEGRTPTNMMLFGTPSKLLNGGRTEEEFYSMLETGYARRCIFGYVKDNPKNLEITPQQLLAQMTNNTSEQFLIDLNDRIANLADIINFNRSIEVSEDVTLIYLEYKIDCEKRAAELQEHDEIRKTEISHRYFKAIKLAATYAFIEDTHEITEEQLYSAIKLVEEAGESFKGLLTRERNYVKLAKYIATVRGEVSHVDLVEDLPFYKGSESAKRELLNLAIAYGYKNNIIIKKLFNDGIEFLKGETLEESDIDNLYMSHSDHEAYRYEFTDEMPFSEISQLTQEPNLHWVTHELVDGHRTEDNCKPGFNMIVIDIDDGFPMAAAAKLMEDYTFHLYTTKRHTDKVNRYRMVFPINYTLKLDAADFKEFMNNFYEWLPFDVDAETNQRSRKWLTHDGEFIDNEGKLIDALPFIPKTSKNEERKKQLMDSSSLTNLERWFVNNTGTGNRSKQLIKFAYLLVDNGMDIGEVRRNVLDLNDKLPDKLAESEISSTILVSAAKAIAARDV